VIYNNELSCFGYTLNYLVIYNNELSCFGYTLNYLYDSDIIWMEMLRVCTLFWTPLMHVNLLGLTCRYS